GGDGMAQLGMVGLGRMGANIVRRLMRDGHDCVVYDVNADPIKELAGEGATGASSLKEMAEKLDAPRTIWVMVPAGEITEYGVMAAYAEGLNILKNANAGKVRREMDAETAPLEHPEYYQYDMDMPQIAEVWRRGSVVGSWLLDLTAAALQESPDLADFGGR